LLQGVLFPEVLVKDYKPKKVGLVQRALRTVIFKILLAVFLLLTIASGTVVAHYYRKYSAIVDVKLSRRMFQNTAKIYGASPRLITNLAGAARSKRRLIEFKDIPKVLIDAVTAGEDQGFFSHHGLAPTRMAGAFFSNLQDDHRLQGGSTITQQLARNIFLTAEPTWRRKLAEAFIAVILELRLTKEQIFTMYANEVYLGQRGSYAIHGFAEGSAALFGKSLSELTLTEAATLAGIIPAPNAYSPSKHPDRAIFRRNLILTAMLKTAKGMVFVEDQLAAQSTKRKNPPNLRPQAGLIALDPRTGEIKAMVGGTNYAASQYNRITHAFRQPGSAFKPFVYAAALETPYDSAPQAPTFDQEPHTQSLDDQFITPLTTIMDAPKVFFYGGAAYSPGNYKARYLGFVTLRIALERSLNLATIRVAERVGFDRVAALAKRMGINLNVKGYPSVALGAFEVTPIELAGAYTAFANEGKHSEPHALLRVVAADGRDLLKTYHYPSRQVLRPEVAYLMTSLMQGVIDHGTGAGVRARGFKLPAAGKTGTSRDGWFAGYTKDLLVIAWVGFDDNRDLNLEGARSALPIWTEFMLKAYELYPVRDTGGMSFNPPPGIEIATIDANTLMRASASYQGTFEEAFIVGTAPTFVGSAP
jgi:penicillin-binding protein 1B